MVANWIVYKGDNLKFKNVFDYKKKYTSIEKMTSKEYIVLIAFIVFLIGTLTSSLHKIAPAWIGLLTFTILLFYSSISEKDFRSQIPWDSMVLLGSLSGTIAALNNAGMSTKLAASLIWVEDYLQHNPYLWATLLLGISSGLRFIIPSASITSIMLASIFIPLSYINGVNSWLVCFMIVMFCDCWFFPYQSGECKQLQREQAFQGNDKMKFLIHNAILSVFKIIAIYASIPYWQKLGLI
jgi:Na+/H+ antiporter NhaD/arsenite permease-like protein